MTFLAVLGWLKRVPWQAWALVGLVALILALRWHWIGVGVERCTAAQEAAQDKQVAKGQEAAKRAQGAATAVKRDIAKVSQSEQAEVRTIVKYLPASCPSQPDRLREIGQRAVERTRASLPAASDG